jgi:hypothetical protein
MDLTPPTALFSPLLANKNATLVFTVSAPTGTTDDFGNYIPATTTVTVVAIMHESGDRQEVAPGVDIDGLLMRGRCVSPKDFPATVYNGMTAQATINGKAGVFTLMQGEGNPYTNNALGKSFMGVFRREGA